MVYGESVAAWVITVVVGGIVFNGVVVVVVWSMVGATLGFVISASMGVDDIVVGTMVVGVVVVLAVGSSAAFGSMIG